MRGRKANKADDKKRNLSVFFSDKKQQLERIFFQAKKMIKRNFLWVFAFLITNIYIFAYFRGLA